MPVIHRKIFHKKVQCLKDLYKITVQDVLIADGVITATANYKLAVTDLKITLCLGKDTDRINSC